MTEAEQAELNAWMQRAGILKNTVAKQSESLLRCAREIKRLRKEIDAHANGADFWRAEANRLRRALEKFLKEFDADERARTGGVRELDEVAP